MPEFEIYLEVLILVLMEDALRELDEDSYVEADAS